MKTPFLFIGILAISHTFLLAQNLGLLDVEGPVKGSLFFLNQEIKLLPDGPGFDGLRIENDNEVLGTFSTTGTTGASSRLIVPQLLTGVKGDGNHLLVLNAERSWAFSQFGTGSSTALKLSAANPDNNNKNFIIDTDGNVGIRDDFPLHQLSLGSGLADTKLALQEAGDGSSSYGMGVQAGHFRFHVGNPQAEFAFYDSQASNANKVFEIEGDGRVFAYDLPFIGDFKNMQYNDATGAIGYDNSSRRYKTNIETLEDDWYKIMSSRPVKYTRPNSPSHWEYGYIAEEMDSLGLTALVGYDAEGIPDDVKYDRMVLYLTEIVKMQETAIQRLQSEVLRLDELEAKMEAIVRPQLSTSGGN